MKQKERFLTINILADRLGVSKDTAYTLVKSGAIKAFRLGERGNYKIKESDYQEFTNTDNWYVEINKTK